MATTDFNKGLADADLVNRHIHVPGQLPSDTSHVKPDNSNAGAPENVLDFMGPDA
jgi:hypothetical protein